jgi:mannose-6-phosphate isomerase-like protein (cupin superfamily)
MIHFHMVKNPSRRSFIRTAPLAAATLTNLPAFAAQATPPEPFQLFKADKLADATAKLHATPGNDNLYASASGLLTIVLTTEEKKSAKEFEYHEGRDHIFQVLEGATTYELGGTPTTPRNTKPGEWLAPGSEGATTVALRKGDMLVIPRGTPHKRTTETSVTFYLISTMGSAKP